MGIEAKRMDDMKVAGIILVTMVITMLLTSLAMMPAETDTVHKVLDAMCKAHGNGSVAMDIVGFDGGYTVRCAQSWQEVVLWGNTTS